MDEEDEIAMKLFNAKLPAGQDPCTEDQFEEVMNFFEDPFLGYIHQMPITHQQMPEFLAGFPGLFGLFGRSTCRQARVAVVKIIGFGGACQKLDLAGTWPSGCLVSACLTCYKSKQAGPDFPGFADEGSD